MNFHVSVMGRILACSLAIAMLASCETLSKPPAPIPPSVCVEREPEPALPDDASIVAPVTEEEREGTRAFLNWTAEMVSWGRRGWDQAERARKACG